MYNITPIAKQDNDAIKNIIQSVILAYDAPKIGTAYSDQDTQRMYEAYQQPRRRYWVIKDEQNNLLGGAGVGPLAGEKNNWCELQKMYFLPQIRGLGLGTKLIHQCLLTAKEMNYQHIYLETMENMVEAQRLYHKIGFDLVDQALGNTGHHACPVAMMMRL